MRVLLVSERSGGHLFPAFSLGEEIKEKVLASRYGSKLFFFVTAPPLKDILAEEGFMVFGRSFSFRNLFLEGIYRFFEAFFLLLKLRPTRVIGFGGRDSFFLLFIARLFLIATAIYEPNFSFGRANKVLALFTPKIYRGFEESCGRLKKSIFSGIPLRKGLRIIDKEEARQALRLDRKKIVISALGGSQGSSFINEIFRKLVSELKDDFQMIHLTGSKEYKDFLKFYSTINRRKYVKAFVKEIDFIYSATDILICRSGAVTLAEAAYFQIPMILLPHPQGFSHQEKNARYFTDRKGAILFLQKGFSLERFKEKVKELIANHELRQSLKDNLGKINIAVSSEEFYAKVFSNQ